MSAEVVDGGRCLFYFNIFFFYLFAYSGRGMGEERGAPREKNESAADRDSSSPKSAIFQFLAKISLHKLALLRDIKGLR